MVRLVFRPYVQVWRTICTSVSLRASTRVSPGFTLLRYSSPSFGSQHIRSHSNLSRNQSRPLVQKSQLLLSLRTWMFIFMYSRMCVDSLVRVSRRVNLNLLNPTPRIYRTQQESTPPFSAHVQGMTLQTNSRGGRQSAQTVPEQTSSPASFLKGRTTRGSLAIETRVGWSGGFDMPTPPVYASYDGKLQNAGTLFPPNR